MPAQQHQGGLLFLVKVEREGRWVRVDGARVVALEDVAVFQVLEFRLKEQRVLRAELDLELSVDLQAREPVVGTDAVVVLILRIHGVAEIAERAVLRGDFTPFSIAGIIGDRVDSKAVAFEHL